MAGTISLDEAASGRWDVLVVGAGPAGGLSAYLNAVRGRRVLLVEKSRFPREKVCGCCLSASGVQILKDVGAGDVLVSGTETRRAVIKSGSKRLEVELPPAVAISRAELDAELVKLACAAGASFMDETLISPGEKGDLVAHCGSETAAVQASLALACDGLRGTLLDGRAGSEWEVDADAWMGASTTLSADVAAPGEIAMHVGEHGYVGVVRLGQGMNHFAAALDPEVCKSSGGPWLLMQGILGSCGVRVEAESPEISGTGLLTRRRGLYGSGNILAVGDACCYVEPFTGEGMTWAIKSACELASWLPDDLTHLPLDLAEKWTRRNEELLGSHQRVCAAIRRVLHRPRLVRPMISLAGLLPGLTRWVVREINSPYRPKPLQGAYA